VQPSEVDDALTVGRLSAVRTRGAPRIPSTTRPKPPPDAEEATVTTEIVRDVQQPYADDSIESERGLLVAVLIMVILGVAGIFAVS
jgi:hypothetical protein